MTGELGHRNRQKATGRRCRVEGVCPQAKGHRGQPATWEAARRRKDPPSFRGGTALPPRSWTPSLQSPEGRHFCCFKPPVREGSPGDTGTLSSPLSQKPFEPAEAQMSSPGRQEVSVSPASLWGKDTRLTAAHTAAPGWPAEESAAQAQAAPQVSSTTAAAVLCPKMKVPRSTEATPQISKPHLRVSVPRQHAPF